MLNYGGGSLFGSYMINKKWPFEEDFSNHLIRAQQVSNAGTSRSSVFVVLQAGLLVNEVYFDEKQDEELPEPLRLEHFYFPLTLWLAGMVLSALSFVLEIIRG